jgi:hypothetical protein
MEFPSSKPIGSLFHPFPHWVEVSFILVHTNRQESVG